MDRILTIGLLAFVLAGCASTEQIERELDAFIGDHVKTAIGTMLMTGSAIGTGCMIACSSHAPTTLGPLRWVTDAGEKPYRIERFLSTARTMMARRERELEPADEARLREISESAT